MRIKEIKLYKFDEVLMNAPEITQEQRENIVKAVNSVERLERENALLKDCHEYLLDFLKAIKADIESGNFGEKGAISMINTAIAKAEASSEGGK